MSTNKDFEKLERLADVFVDDLFSASDEQIIQEAREDGDLETIDSRFSKIVFQAQKQVGLRRLEEARRMLGSRKSDSSNLVKIDADDARKRVLAAIANGNSLITTAARNGIGLSNNDAVSLFYDFLELGVVRVEEE